MMFIMRTAHLEKYIVRYIANTRFPYGYWAVQELLLADDGREYYGKEVHAYRSRSGASRKRKQLNIALAIRKVYRYSI